MSGLDDRLRNALHDLDGRVAVSVNRSENEQRTPVRARTAMRGRVLAPVLAAVAVLAVLIGTAVLRDEERQAAPSLPSPAVTTTKADSPEEAAGPSQTPAEAERDGVYPQLAQLTMSQRVAPPSLDESFPERRTPEGIWTVRIPDWPEDEPSPFRDGCLEPVDAERDYRFCEGEYSEMLLLSADRSRILRAFPMADNMYWLTVTPDAVYCGHSGDGALPNSSLCRIDRKTLKVTGVRFACPEGLSECYDNPGDAARVRKYPGKWFLGGPVAGAADVKLTNAGAYPVLTVLDDQGLEVTTVDPQTLEPPLF